MRSSRFFYYYIITGIFRAPSGKIVGRFIDEICI